MADEDVEGQLTRATRELARDESIRRPAVELIEQRARHRRRRRSMTRWGAIAAVFAAVLVGAGVIATMSRNDNGDSISVSEPSTVSRPATSVAVPPATTIPSSGPGVRTMPWISTVVEPDTREPFRHTLDATGVSNAPACVLGDLEVVALISGAGGADYAGITVRNQSSQPCAVQGSPYVGLLDTSGRSLGTYTPTVAPTDPVIVLMPGSWARVGLTPVGGDSCGANGGTTAAAIAFGISAGETRVVHPAPEDGFNPNGCPAGVAGDHTGAFESIPSASADGLLYEPLRTGMTLQAPEQVQRGTIATYSVTFANTDLNTFLFSDDDCPLYQETLGATASGTLLLNCNGATGIYVRTGESVRFEMKLAVPADQPLGPTTLRWQYIEPNLPALSAPVEVIDHATPTTPRAALDLHTVDWNNVSVPGSACFQDHDIQLHDGGILLRDDKRGTLAQPESKGVGFDRLERGGTVVYGDVDGDGHDDAAVPLDCNNNGGTADGLLLDSSAVYSGATGTLTSLGLITPQVQREHQAATLLTVASLRPGAITADESVYGPNDFSCCPTGKATTTWTLSSGELVPGAPVISKEPK